MDQKQAKARTKWRQIQDIGIILLASLLFVISCVGLFHPPLLRAVSALAMQKDQPIRHGREDLPAVAIACNIYQNEQQVEQLLDLFEKENVSITFFVGGTWVARNPELTKRIVEEGHEIGNHGHRHRAHSNLNKEQNIEEIQACTDAVEQAAGYKMKLFMPPSGDFNQFTVDAAQSLGYTTVLWSADTIDWRDRDATIIRDRAAKRMHPGAIILTHPMEQTVQAMPGILADIRAKGWSIITVSELINQ